MKDQIGLATAGTGNCSDELYASLLDVMKDDIEFVGVWRRSPEKAGASVRLLLARAR